MLTAMSQIDESVLEEPQPELVEAPRLEPSDTQPFSLSRAFGGRSLVREIVETALLALLTFILLNTLTGRFQVRGSSMEPTLHDGQY
ncbi:MAG: hypothetical protein ACOC8C_02615, partial [Chloroflexota bacterium]